LRVILPLKVVLPLLCIGKRKVCMKPNSVHNSFKTAKYPWGSMQKSGLPEFKSGSVGRLVLISS
jgi:hypothetical protein